MHEASMHRHNAWLTLTYADEHLPGRYNTGLVNPLTKKPIYSGTLHKEHMQKFFRALRKALGRKKTGHAILGDLMTAPRTRSHPKRTLRYYYGGEYGEKFGRPHYHACLFGIDLGDKLYESKTNTGYKLYTSPTITRLWPYGTHLIGELTWESAAYTARYIMKKINGKRKEQHYEKIDHDTGEILKIEPEYNDMSRRPGIAKTWLDKFLTDVYPHDRVIVRGHETKPPRYYDKRYEHRLKFNFNDDDLEGAYAELTKPLEQIKFGRQIEAKLHWRDQTDERLKVQETVTNRRIQSIKQKF